MPRLALWGAPVFFAVASAMQTGGPPADSRLSRRSALVIGNQSYRASPLENPVNDAVAMRGALESLGFNVLLFTDQTAADMRTRIESWGAGLTPDSVAIFYFAGHGVQIDGENYLIPVDFKEITEAEAKKNAINADWVRQRLEVSPATLRLIILDACRNNPFRSRGGSNVLAGMRSAEGTFIALSTGPGTTASDGGDQRNGLFTGFLVDALKQHGLELMDLFSQVRAQVYQATEKRQVPGVYSGVVGKFYFQPPAGWVDPRLQKQSDDPSTKTSKSDDPEKVRRRTQLRDSHLAPARRLLQEKKYTEALGELQMAGDADEESIEVLTLLTIVQEQLQQLDAAIATASKGIGRAPRSAELYRLRGTAHFEAGHFSDAIVDLSRAIEIAPDAQAYWLRSVARVRVGDLVGAEADRHSQHSLTKQPGSISKK